VHTRYLYLRLGYLYLYLRLGYFVLEAWVLGTGGLGTWYLYLRLGYLYLYLRLEYLYMYSILSTCTCT